MIEAPRSELRGMFCLPAVLRGDRKEMYHFQTRLLAPLQAAGLASAFAVQEVKNQLTMHGRTPHDESATRHNQEPGSHTSGASWRAWTLSGFFMAATPVWWVSSVRASVFGPVWIQTTEDARDLLHSLGGGLCHE